jgi:iron complex transport system substrate-binding protein
LVATILCLVLPTPPLRTVTLLVLALLAGACDGDRNAGAGVPGPVSDDLGRAVELTAAPQRVIPLAPNLTELLFAVGAGERVIAVSAVDDYPRGVETLPRLGTLPVDLERVVALAPDLLLANSAVNRTEEPDRLATLGLPTYFFSFERVADVPRALRTLGELLLVATSADSAAHAFEARIGALRAWSTALSHRPRTLLLIGDQPLHAFGGASYTQELIRLAGGESITAHFSGEGVTLSSEFVLEAAPAVIVGAWGDEYDPARLVSLHPSWREVPAVAGGRIYSLDPDLLVRAGPRLAEGAERLATLLHPGAGPSPDRR